MMQHRRTLTMGEECAPDCPACFQERSKQNPFMTTFTGRKVHPMALKPEDICIEDIAHHLATQNRWCGALREPISIAQHCWHLSWFIQGTGEELEGLMHENDEAYLGEITRWIKHSPALTEFREAGERANRTCAIALGYSEVPSGMIKTADARMVSIEAEFGITGWSGQPGYPPVLESERQRAYFTFGSMHWQKAEQLFLARYHDLQYQRRQRCFSQR